MNEPDWGWLYPAFNRDHVLLATAFALLISFSVSLAPAFLGDAYHDGIEIHRPGTVHRGVATTSNKDPLRDRPPDMRLHGVGGRPSGPLPRGPATINRLPR